MESKDEFKEIDIKNRTCSYFHVIMRAWDRDIDFDFSSVLLYKKLYKGKYENVCIIVTIKSIHLLKFIMELYIWYYLINVCLIKLWWD